MPPKIQTRAETRKKQGPIQRAKLNQPTTLENWISPIKESKKILVNKITDKIEKNNQKTIAQNIDILKLKKNPHFSLAKQNSIYI